MAAKSMLNLQETSKGQLLFLTCRQQAEEIYMRCRLLIIEDTQAIIDLLRDALLATFPELDICDCGFKKATDELERFRPEVVILDLSEGTTDGDAAHPSWDFIWKRHFCPVIIHSAYDASGYQPQNHPFSRYERKTHESAAKVVAALKELSEHIEGVRALRREIENGIGSSLREVSPLVWREPAQANERRDMLLRVTRRRLAAALEYPLNGEPHIKAWEQFIYPPIESGLLTGDVLCPVGGQVHTPFNYRIILTPSCDLAEGANRTPVSEVLVARCIPVNDAEVVRKCGFQQVVQPNLAVKLGEELQRDKTRLDGMMVLPGLAGVWSPMIVDFKKLELLSRASIATTHGAIGDHFTYRRLASMDSPFRESIAWRFAQTTGRPGLPEVDRPSLGTDVQTAAAINPN
jgi:CheY-like chemotaxis protein